MWEKVLNFGFAKMMFQVGWQLLEPPRPEPPSSEPPSLEPPSLEPPSPEPPSLVQY